MKASSYSSFLNAVIVVALTCSLVLNLISQTSSFFLFFVFCSFLLTSLQPTTEVVKFACAFKLGSALLNLHC